MKFSIPKLSFLKPAPYREHVHPVQDWLIIVAGALILFLVSVGWNVWTFGRVARGESLTSVAASTSAPLDTSALDALPAFFDDRTAETARYQSEYRFVDPSK